MWIDHLIINDIRSFEYASLEFARGINLIVGKNNAGKSTLLLPILTLQTELPRLSQTDIRLNRSNAYADCSFAEFDSELYKVMLQGCSVEIRPEQTMLKLLHADGNASYANHSIFSNREPNNWIYPFLSRRKTVNVGEKINAEIASRVVADFANLNTKIDRVADPELREAYQEYAEACNNILGIKITTTPSTGGKHAVYKVDNWHHISLSAMGKGVTNIIGLITQLVVAEHKLFLIEEPENDVHPRALKALLDLIIKKSDHNQFIITTHSNIVLKKLGAVPDSKVFLVDSSFKDLIPTSTVREVEPTPENRRWVLNELGYELFDDDLWDAWIFFEESSAEKIIREYLIPWFSPYLSGRVRTYSAHSLSEVAPKLRNFNDLFVFLHLLPIYKNRVWVIVDAGEEEGNIIESLKSTYRQSGWQEEQFLQFENHDFEDYYPERFHEDTEDLKQMANSQEKQQKKKALLRNVECWIQSDIDAAKDEFAQSASEVIEILQNIEAKLKESQKEEYNQQ